MLMHVLVFELVLCSQLVAGRHGKLGERQALGRCNRVLLVMLALMLLEMAHGVVWTYGGWRCVDAIQLTILTVHLVDLYFAQSSHFVY